MKGCTVIGIVGSEDKLKWCRDELGFDHVINYKTEDFSEELRRIAPGGVDIYFDNVGGDYYHTVINHHMRNRGRVLVCGSIQTYNSIDAQLCKFLTRDRFGLVQFLVRFHFSRSGN